MFAAVFDSVYHVDSYLLVIRSWIVSFPFVIKDIVFINAPDLEISASLHLVFLFWRSISIA
jgi:hypothetical protein